MNGKLIKYGDEGDKALNMRAFSWGIFYCNDNFGFWYICVDNAKKGEGKWKVKNDYHVNSDGDKY